MIGKDYKNGAIEMSFSWLFATIVGAVILFLALYMATQLGGNAEYQQQTESGKKLTILIDPLETGAASTSGDIIRFVSESRITFRCYLPTIDNAFGKETLAVSEKNRGEWNEDGGEIAMRNKFIFAENGVIGKKIYLFSKPFFMGFKVADLIITTADSYCFVNTPQEIEDELKEITSFDKMNFSAQVEDCPKTYTTVCFGGQNYDCNLSASSDDEYETGIVYKNDERLAFAGSLLYGAIFSSPEIYECNVNRLAVKTGELAAVYREKASLVAIKDCNTAIESELDTLALLSVTLEASTQLPVLYSFAQEMDKKNKGAECELYAGENY